MHAKHYKHNEDGRRAPGVCGNGSVPLSHSGNVVTRTGLHTHINFCVMTSVFAFQIADNYGTFVALCGVRNDTKADTLESRLNHLYIFFHTNEIISARGFNFSYKIHAGKLRCVLNKLRNINRIEEQGASSFENRHL